MEQISRRGEVGWIGLAAFVIAWDMFAGETMSSAFRRGLENERTRPFVLGGLGITALHLLNALPEPYDPFKQLGQIKDLLHES